MSPLAVCGGFGEVEEGEALRGGKDIIEDTCVERGVFGEGGSAEVDRLFGNLSWDREETRSKSMLVTHDR